MSCAAVSCDGDLFLRISELETQLLTLDDSTKKAQRKLKKDFEVRIAELESLTEQLSHMQSSVITLEGKLKEESGASSTMLVSKNEFDFGDRMWISIPNSVNGTLIYYLSVVHNRKEMSFIHCIYCLWDVYLPVISTYYYQSLLLYWFWAVEKPFGGLESLCTMSYSAQHCIIALYIIFLIPSVNNIIREIACISRSRRFCFEVDNNYR